MNARTIRMITAAAILAAAAQARGQTKPEGEGSWRVPKVPGKTEPAPAPPATKQPGSQAQPAPQAQAALDEQNRSILGTLSLRNHFAIEVSQIAAQRGTSNEVKQLGERLVTEHQRLEEDVGKMVTSRGGTLASLPKPESERAAHEQLVQRLKGLSGAEFDREFVLAVQDVQRGYVEDLKRMRDATPGKDADLKRWLDNHEDLAEERLTATRQVKQALDAKRAAQR